MLGAPTMCTLMFFWYQYFLGIRNEGPEHGAMLHKNENENYKLKGGCEVIMHWYQDKKHETNF